MLDIKVLEEELMVQVVEYEKNPILNCLIKSRIIRLTKTFLK